jgi:hypothetical protein
VGAGGGEGQKLTLVNTFFILKKKFFTLGNKKLVSKAVRKKA